MATRYFKFVLSCGAVGGDKEEEVADPCINMVVKTLFTLSIPSL